MGDRKMVSTEELAEAVRLPSSPAAASNAGTKVGTVAN